MNIIYIMITNKIKYMLHECYIISANNDTINLSAYVRNVCIVIARK